MGFLDYFSLNTSLIRSTEILQSGLDSATAVLQKDGLAKVDEGVDAFSSVPDPGLEPTSEAPKEVAAPASFLEPYKYFGNYSLIDSNYVALNGYVQDNSFPYAKEIENFTPALNDFVFDYGFKLVETLPSIQTRTGAIGALAVDPAPAAVSTPVSEAPTEATIQSQPVPAKSVYPLIQLSSTEGKSGEGVVSDAIGTLTTSIDDLMKEASSLDLSTTEGQSRLAAIQLQFAQASRHLEALSQILAKFNEMQQRINQNLGR